MQSQKVILNEPAVVRRPEQVRSRALAMPLVFAVSCLVLLRPHACWAQSSPSTPSPSDAGKKAREEARKRLERVGTDSDVSSIDLISEALERASDASKNGRQAIDYASKGDLEAAERSLKKAHDLAQLALEKALRAGNVARRDGDPALAERIRDAYDKAKDAMDQFDTVKRSVDNLAAKSCGGNTGRRRCWYAGVIVASASFATVAPGSKHHGSTSHAIISALLPTFGHRWLLLSEKLSIDVGLLSMLLSRDIAALQPTSHAACRTGISDFEAKLPCEGNASVIPWLAAYGGLTYGNADIGFISVNPMMGLATTSLDRSVHFFTGLSLGVAGLSSKF